MPQSGGSANVAAWAEAARAAVVQRAIDEERRRGMTHQSFSGLTFEVTKTMMEKRLSSQPKFWAA